MLLRFLAHKHNMHYDNRDIRLYHMACLKYQHLRRMLYCYR